MGKGDNGYLCHIASERFFHQPAQIADGDWLTAAQEARRAR
jgi:hypothetical protein